MKLGIFTAGTMQESLLWDVTLYGLVEIYQNFRGTWCLYHQNMVPPECQ